MKTWKTNVVTINEVDFDHDLHAFEVYSPNEKLLGIINPDSVEDMHRIIGDLNKGACPVTDRWEDGNGNTCTIEGWGK